MNSEGFRFICFLKKKMAINSYMYNMALQAMAA